MLKMPTLNVHDVACEGREDRTKVAARDVNVFYGEKQALKNVVDRHSATARSRPSSARRAAASRPSCAASTA